MTHHTNRAPSALWQRVENEAWPERDENGPHALSIPIEPTERTPVRVRLKLARDGWVILDGVIERRANGCVYVRVDDPRVTLGFAWVTEGDVQRYGL